MLKIRDDRHVSSVPTEELHDSRCLDPSLAEPEALARRWLRHRGSSTGASCGGMLRAGPNCCQCARRNDNPTLERHICSSIDVILC
jgi:hypothetical protein